MATGSFDWCCSRASEITAHLEEIAPGMTDDEISWLPRYVQAEARAIRDAYTQAREG